MRIGTTGTQSGGTLKQKQAFRRMLSKVSGTLHFGDCIGWDEEAFEIAKSLGYPTVCHPPENDYKRAYCEADEILPVEGYRERNTAIVKASQVLIACPKEFEEVMRSGTWMTLRIAQKLHKPIRIIWPNGVVKKIGKEHTYDT